MEMFGARFTVCQWETRGSRMCWRVYGEGIRNGRTNVNVKKWTTHITEDGEEFGVVRGVVITLKKFAEFDPTKLTAALDPDPLEVRHMIYKSDWGRRPKGSRPGLPLEMSRFTDHWKDQKEEGYVESGVTYKVTTRPPRSGFTCSICQKIMDQRRNATSRTAREELSFKLRQHLQQVVSIPHYPIGSACRLLITHSHIVVTCLF